MHLTPGTHQHNLVRLAVATVATYIVGYSLVLVAHSSVGWVFVSFGGLLLLATGIQTVRHIHRSPDSDRTGQPASGSVEPEP